MKLAALLVMSCWASTASAQWIKSRRDLQHDAADRFAPTAIQLRQQRATTPLRTFKIRVYATDDYRAQNFDWASRFRRLLDGVNRELGFWPGVRLEIEGLRPWQHDSSKETLKQLLRALTALDAGNDVDWVIGLGSAMSTIPDNIHDIGDANFFDKHFVMRALQDLGEYNLLRNELDELSIEERDRVLAARKAHKEAVIFLHEWAHTLGGIHAQHFDRIMNPHYTRDQTRLSDVEARVIEVGLADRNDPALWRRDLAPIVAQPDPEWDPRDRQVLRAWIDQTATSSPSSVSPGADSLAQLLEVAQGQLRDRVDADATLARAEAEVTRAPTRARWRAVAHARQAAFEPTFAIADAVHAGRDDGETMKVWSLWARRKLAMPFDAAEHGLPPEREGEYARLFAAGLEALDAKKLDAAAESQRALEAGFPSLPAPTILRCGLSLRRRDRGADKECREALARQEDAITTLQMMAALADATGKRKQASAYRARAAELDAPP